MLRASAGLNWSAAVDFSGVQDLGGGKGQEMVFIFFPGRLKEDGFFRPRNILHVRTVSYLGRGRSQNGSILALVSWCSFDENIAIAEIGVRIFIQLPGTVDSSGVQRPGCGVDGYARAWQQERRQ